MVFRNKLDNYIIWTVILSFILLSTIFSSSKNLWLDETHSTLLASLSFSDLIIFVKGDVHPPLYFISVWLWSGLFGDSLLSFRMLSVVSHVAASLTFFLTLLLIVKPRIIRLTFFILFLFSPVLFWYSIEVRMYSLLVLFVTLSIYFMLKIISHEKRQVYNSIYLAIFLSLSFYTHYTAVFYIIGLFLFFAYKVIQNKEKYLKWFIVSALATLMFTAPWYTTLLEQREVKLGMTEQHLNASQDIESLGYTEEIFSRKRNEGKYLIKEIILNLASISGVYPAKNIFVLILALIPFLILLALFFKNTRKSDSFVVFSIFVLVTCIFSMTLLGLVSRRYIILLTPIILLLMAKVLSESYEANTKIVLAISFGLLVSSAVNIYSMVTKHYHKPVYNLVTGIRDSAGSNKLVIVSAIHGQIPIEYAAKQLNIKLNITGFPMSIHDWWSSQKFKGWGSPLIYKDDVLNFYEVNLAKNDIKQFWLVLFENTQYDKSNFLLSYIKSMSKSVELVSSYRGQFGKGELYTLYKVNL